MNSFVKSLPRLAAAAVFALGTSTAVVVGDATHAGAPVNGITTAAAQPASAGVAIGITVGGGRYYRYGYRGGAWVNLGYGYAAAPGYVNGYYYGYAPPAIGFGYAPRPYYARPYGYTRGYYGRAEYGRAEYGRGAYGRASYGRGGYRR